MHLTTLFTCRYRQVVLAHKHEFIVKKIIYMFLNLIFGFENYSDLCFITFKVDSVETASDISLAKHLRMPTVSNLCEFFTSHKRNAPFINFSNQVCSLSVVCVEALVLDFPHVLFILQNIWLNISKRNIFFLFN